MDRSERKQENKTRHNNPLVGGRILEPLPHAANAGPGDHGEEHKRPSHHETSVPSTFQKHTTKLAGLKDYQAKPRELHR